VTERSKTKARKKRPGSKKRDRMSARAAQLDEQAAALGVEPVEAVADLALGTHDQFVDLARATRPFRTEPEPPE